MIYINWTVTTYAKRVLEMKKNIFFSNNQPDQKEKAPSFQMHTKLPQLPVFWDIKDTFPNSKGLNH